MNNYPKACHNKDGWCAFCDELNNKGTSNLRKIITSDEIPNPVLLSTENFAVVPGLGPLNHAYLLIVPKEPFTSMGAIPEHLQQELTLLKNDVRTTITSLYSPPIMFEHGPAVNQPLMAGCCVEHAHIHVFATQEDLLDILHKDYETGKFGFHSLLRPQRIDSFIKLKKWLNSGVSYLWYEGNNEHQWIFPVVTNIPSQYLRRVLSSKLKLPDPLWDWGLYPEKNKIIETWQSLKDRLCLDNDPI